MLRSGPFACVRQKIAKIENFSIWNENRKLFHFILLFVRSVFILFFSDIILLVATMWALASRPMTIENDKGSGL